MPLNGPSRQVFRASILALTLAIVGTAGARAAEPRSHFGSAAADHALYLQTQGTFPYVIPCTTAGMSTAVQQADDAAENRDGRALVFQESYASVFAVCAINAETANQYATFAAASLQASTTVAVGHVAFGLPVPRDRSRAEQALVIARFLLNYRYAPDTSRAIARRSLALLREAHLI